MEFLVAAMLGGFVVSVGLVLEKFSEWLDDHFTGGYRAHKKMEGQEQEEPPMGGEGDIKGDIAEAEGDAGRPDVTDPVECRPGGVAVAERRFGFQLILEIIQVDIFGLHHEAPDVLYKMGGVGVFFRVAVGVMHPVKDGIGAGVEERGALGEEREEVKELFPELIHLKHLVRSVAVQEERL